jgi:hypothetical protein
MEITMKVRTQGQQLLEERSASARVHPLPGIPLINERGGLVRYLTSVQRSWRRTRPDDIT